MAARFAYWYLHHPMWGRTLVLLCILYWLAIVLTALAPPAFAATNAEALNWTGVKDAHNVPLGNYYLASVDLYEAAKASAPDVSWDPSTWQDWVGSVTTTMGGGAIASVILTIEAGLFVGLLTISVWLFRLAASSVWLTFFATLARPFVDAIFILVAKAGLLLWLLPLAVFAGGWVALVKGAGARGWMMIVSAMLVATLGVALLADPVSLMYGEHGLLAIARGSAFKVAEAAVHNGPAVTQPLSGASPLDAFTGDLITAVARRPFQMWQYGHVLSGGCDQAWTTAMLTHPSDDAPIRAMETCGNYAGARHASTLNGNNVWLGALLVAAALMFTYFMLVAAGALVRVPAQALYRVIKAPVDINIGILDGAGRHYMWFAVKKFLFCGLELFAYTLFICIAGMAIGRVMASPLPAELGGNSPVAKVLMFAAAAAVATSLFRLMQAELFDHQQARGPFGRMALGAAGAAASVIGAKGLAAAAAARAVGSRGSSSPPWEQLESKMGDAGGKLGTHNSGFDTISSAKQDSSVTGTDGGRSVATGGGSGGDRAPRAVPTPTPLQRPSNRRDGAAPGRGSGLQRSRPQPVPRRQSRSPVSAAPDSDGSQGSQRGFDTIAADPRPPAASRTSAGPQPRPATDSAPAPGLDTISPNPTNQRDS